MKKLTPLRIKYLKMFAEHFRRSSFFIIKNAGSGHLGACSSSAELMTVLYFSGILKIDLKDIKNPNRDIVLVRGHLGPLRYKIFSVLGLIDEEELSLYRKIGSRLKGHESMEHVPGVDITPSGSLGMILSYAVGACIVAKRNKTNSKAYVFLGDGEEQEGNIAEAARHAGSLNLNNLICIIDKNRKQLSRATICSDKSTNLKNLWESYGFEVLEIDGHDVFEIYSALKSCLKSKKPSMIIANTLKGKGIKGHEKHYSGYHTLSTCKTSEMDKALLDRTGLSNFEIKKILKNFFKGFLKIPKRNYEINKPRIIYKLEVDERNNMNLDNAQLSFFRDLEREIKNTAFPHNFYMLTSDFIKSDVVKLAKLDKFMSFFDVGLREQHMIGLAHGISVMDKNSRIIINYGDAFLYRALDQLNASAQGESNLIILSEYAGLSQGQNGETHQSVSQPMSLSNVPGINLYEPGDVNDLYYSLNKALNKKGIHYIRIHREDMSILPNKSNSKGCYLMLDDRRPDLVIVTSGLLAEQSFNAGLRLIKEFNKKVRIVNIVDFGLINNNLISSIVQKDKPLFTFYNGHPNTIGGMLALKILENENDKRPAFIKNYGYLIGDTGKVEELLKKYNLDTSGIIKTVLESC